MAAALRMRYKSRPYHSMSRLELEGALSKMNSLMQLLLSQSVLYLTVRAARRGEVDIFR